MVYLMLNKIIFFDNIKTHITHSYFRSMFEKLRMAKSTLGLTQTYKTTRVR
jgi:hypothetical protein